MFAIEFFEKHGQIYCKIDGVLQICVACDRPIEYASKNWWAANHHCDLPDEEEEQDDDDLVLTEGERLAAGLAEEDPYEDEAVRPREWGEQYGILPEQLRKRRYD